VAAKANHEGCFLFSVLEEIIQIFRISVQFVAKNGHPMVVFSQEKVVWLNLTRCRLPQESVFGGTNPICLR